MSIIIKGMKMPQKEGDYDARLHVNRDGTALFYLYKGCGVHVAKEIPPHEIPVSCDSGIDGELQQYCNILNAISEHERKLEAIIARFSPFNRNIEEEKE